MISGKRRGEKRIWKRRENVIAEEPAFKYARWALGPWGFEFQNAGRAAKPYNTNNKPRLGEKPAEWYSSPIGSRRPNW